jgi:D-alanyl-lipoteichoic acid acyltransferase DltB (MBOAT superfamily)
MLWGLFKKVVVADNLARFVDFCYDNPNDHSPMSLIFATVFFSAQIYCDFSGYSDIALGSAQSMGFKLMTNFKLPYISQNISEFWSRWHISLSTWFRDYLYIPLGGNRVKKSRWYMNLMIVFLVSGLWHGANYTFIIWGALHGLYLIVGILTADFQKKYLPRFAHHLFTIILVMFAWIFFRAKSFELSKQIITHSLNVIHLGMSGFASDLSAFGPGIFLVLLFLLLVFFSIDQFVSKVLDQERTISANRSMILFASLMAMLLIFGFYGQTQFIYFQF